MNVQVKSSNGITLVPIESRLMADRKIFIESEIDANTACEFVKKVLLGAVLFACGTHGRYILPHGELMLHEPLLGNRVGGNSSSIKSISDSLLETKKTINQILVRHTGKSEDEVEKATSFDHYFSPEESVAFGLCDKIVGFDMLMEG